ncbi:hypothetical protein PPYR_15439, partial [Photinus pyralis]
LAKELLPCLVDTLKSVFVTKKDSTEYTATRPGLTVDTNKTNKREEDQRTPSDEDNFSESSQFSSSQQNEKNKSCKEA